MKNNITNVIEVLEKKIGTLSDKQLNEIISYFELTDKKPQLEMFDKGDGGKRTKIANNIHIILESVLELFIDEITRKEENKHRKMAEKVESFIANTEFIQKDIAENANISEDYLTKYKRSALKGEKIKLPRVYDKLSEFFNSANIKDYIIADEDNVINIYENKLNINHFSEAEKNNLSGTYLLFHRSNFHITRDKRVLCISELEISKDSESSKLKYRLFRRGSNGETFKSEGDIIRNTPNMLLLFGVKKSADEICGLETMLLSIGDINRLSTEKGKKHINGSYAEFEEDTNKPYTTWVHLSKVKDKILLKKDSGITWDQINYAGYTDKVVSAQINFDDFNTKELTPFKKHIIGNYPAHGTFPKIVAYIRDLLKLDNEIAHLL